MVKSIDEIVISNPNFSLKDFVCSLQKKFP